MKTNKAVLEYCVARSKVRRKGEWGFRFRGGDGRILMESRGGYTSLDKAEQGFLSLVKSIATNQYAIDVSKRARLSAQRKKSSPQG